MDVRTTTANIDWQPLQDHIAKRIKRNDPRYARKVADFALFSNFPEESRQTFVEKVSFSTIDDFPPCVKYRTPTFIEFVHAEPIWCGNEMMPLSVKIERLLQNEPEHFLHLHPERFDNVKLALTNGRIDMPIVYLNEEGRATVGGGRHRIVALFIYKFEYIEVSVPKADILEIQEQLCGAAK